MNTTTTENILEEQSVADRTAEIELSLQDLDLVGGGSMIQTFS